MMGQISGGDNEKTNKWDIGWTEDASDFKIQVHMKNGDEYAFWNIVEAAYTKRYGESVLVIQTETKRESVKYVISRENIELVKFIWEDRRYL